MTYALTLTQPWATLVMTSAKRVETRAWRTRLQGGLAIHAASSMPCWVRELWADEPYRAALQRAGIVDLKTLPRGALLGSVTMTGCVPTEKILTGMVAGGSPDELLFGDFTPGRFGWLLASPAPLTAPIPMRGRQRLWRLPAGCTLQSAYAALEVT